MYSEQNVRHMYGNVLKTNVNVPKCVREIVIIFPQAHIRVGGRSTDNLGKCRACSWVFSRDLGFPRQRPVHNLAYGVLSFGDLSCS